MRQFRKIIILLILLVYGSCQTQTIEKINGVSLVATPKKMTPEDVDPVLQVHANWAAVIPFGFVPGSDKTNLVYNVERQWWGERHEGVQETIKMLHDKGIKAMLKPQLWMRGGQFTGHFDLETEDEWTAFESKYEAYVLDYAGLAELTGTEMFCLGTELNNFVTKRPQFWMQLIDKVREVYHGQLTYAENWDTFESVPFWKKLDFIGIDAYFPLSEIKTPSVEEAMTGWEVHKKTIGRLHQRIGKPVLFTEYGYRSVDFAGKEPWNSSRDLNEVNHGAQVNLLNALYEEFWSESWFKGGFLWKWFPEHNRAGGMEDTQYSVQNKPAQSVVKEKYGGQ